MQDDGPDRTGANGSGAAQGGGAAASSLSLAGPAAAGKLSSWKEIADHLGVNVRTAQKWERERGLPVRRLPGTKGRVSAERAALDAWRQSTLSTPVWYNSLTFLRRYSLVVTAVAAATLGLAVRGYLLDHGRGRPALFQVDSRTLSVFDSRRHELWQQTFDEPLAVPEYGGAEGQQRVWFGDIDGDGSTDVLFLQHPADEAGVTSYLLCYSETGQLKWRFAPDTVIADGTQSYKPPYILAAFAVTDSPTGKMIAVTGRHPSYHPTSVALLDRHGRRRGEYWHTGHLDYLAFDDLDRDGVPEVLLAGVDNAREQATLVVLDSRAVTGASFAGEGSPWQIHGMPTGREKATVYFPRTCVNRLYERYNMARDITVTSNGLIRVKVYERLDQDELVVHTLDRSLRSIGAVISDRLVATHRRLQADGRLDHQLTDSEAAALQGIRVVRPLDADR